MKIETKRLLLISADLAPEKLEKEIRWLTDPEAVKYSEQRHKRHTVMSQGRYVASFEHPDALFEIHLKGPSTIDAFIGTVSVLFDMPNKCADLGILIGDRDVWGNGYGREAWQTAMKYAHSMGAERVTCGFREDNSRMLHLALKSGMGFSHADHNRFIADGVRTAALYYENVL